MKKIHRFICAVLLALLAIQGIWLPGARADADMEPRMPRFPESGSTVKTDDRLTIDYSHADQGYVLVKAKKSDKRMQLKVSHGKDSVCYEINGEGRDEVIPLQFGSGKYTFTLAVSRKKGSRQAGPAGSVTIQCSMTDESSCFLYPNQYVSYDADSPLVAEAQNLCEGMSDPLEIAKTICAYVRRHFSYDWMKAEMIKSDRTKNLLPDIGSTWETGKGVCQDLSALTCAMLRSQGIPAKLAIGRADGNYHSWVVMVIDGKTRRFDPSLSAGSYQAERYY